MSIFDKFKHSALAGLIHDQHLKELITRREFRISEEFIHREFISQAADEEILNPELRFFDGFGELRCQVKKKLLPAINFSARFTIHGLEFSSLGKRLHLRLEEVKPLDFNWVTKRMIGRLPFLTLSDGIMTCDLTQVPRLAYLFSYQVKGIQVVDHFTLRDLAFKEGEVVGRLGVVL
jgi:hypothetical protein